VKKAKKKKNIYIWEIRRQNTDPSSPIIKSWKTFANLVDFLRQDVFERKNKKMARKIR
jgi:hypothetical protein